MRVYVEGGKLECDPDEKVKSLGVWDRKGEILMRPRKGNSRID